MPSTNSYSSASGTPIYGGRVAPMDALDWVPAAGQLKSVHLNDLASLNPCPSNVCWYSEASHQNGPWANWNGAVFAPGYSEYGAMIFWGGGHGGYDGIEHYLFDLTTRQWSVVGAAATPDYDFLPDLDPTWCDLPYQGSLIIPASHTYCHPVYLPPGYGGGTKGSWCLPFNVFGPLGSISGSAQPHALDLGSGVMTRLTSNTLSINLGGGPYGGCFVDTNRKTLWLMPGQDSNQNAKIDLTQSTKTLELVTSFYNPGYYFTPCFVPEKDMLIAGAVQYGDIYFRVTGYDLASGTPVQFSIAVDAPLPDTGGRGQFGFDWCPDTGKFYAYSGFGGAVLGVLTPPTDWKAGTWSWGTETMGGETPIDTNEVANASQGGQPYTKWQYNRALRCFMWSQGTAARVCTDGVTRAGAFQLYKPIGVH